VCAAAWLTPDASAIIAGDAAATIVIASRARIFAFMSFPAKSIGLMGYESRVLNTHQKSLHKRKLDLTSLRRQNIQSQAITMLTLQKCIQNRLGRGLL
jgi:hypothetical protein